MPNWQEAMGSGAAAGSMITPGVGTAIGAGLDLIGGVADAYFGQKASDRQWKREKKVLQNQIQWRVEDAVKAGLHPLVGAGISPSSGPAGMPVGTDFAGMGQNIGRAAEALLDPRDKLAARDALLDMAQKEANVNYTNAQTALAQKALLRQPGGAPGIVMPPDAPRSSKFGNIPTRNVQQGQISEDWGGDMLGSLIAAVATMDDFVRYNWNSKDLKKNMPGPWYDPYNWFQ